MTREAKSLPLPLWATTTQPIIDLRSALEYSWGHIPGAVNLPLLSDDERHHIGTAYKTEGKVTAVQLGLEAFAAKAPAFYAEFLHISGSHEATYVHCARGGMRSRSVYLWLRALGHSVEMIAGGYKTFRQEVLATCETLGSQPMLTLTGRTGSGKTDFLRGMVGHVPLLDFEELAKHRGSAFGDFAINEPQPTQQNFENFLAKEFLSMPSSKRLLVEIENFIGVIELPLPVRRRVFSSPMVLLEREFDDRVARLTNEYAPHWNEHWQQVFEVRAKLLTKHVSKEILTSIVESTRKRDIASAVALLLKHRYDPVYDKSIKKYEALIHARFNVSEDSGMKAAKEYVEEQCGGLR